MSLHLEQQPIMPVNTQFYHWAFAAAFLFGVRVWYIERHDRKQINVAYQSYAKDNAPCRKYLRTVTNEPVWRMAYMYALFIMALTGTLYLALQYPVREEIYPMSLVYFLVTGVGIYKLLTTYQWHYVCDGGCTQCSKVDDNGSCIDSTI
jgi:hypothetical protein